MATKKSKSTFWPVVWAVVSVVALVGVGWLLLSSATSPLSSSSDATTGESSTEPIVGQDEDQWLGIDWSSPYFKYTGLSYLIWWD